MEMTERLEWLIVGGLIGFILGFIVSKVSDIREDVHDIKEELGTVDKNVQRIKDDRGSFPRPTLSGVALFVVVLLAFASAFLSQRASNTSNETSRDQKQNIDCTTQFLFDAIKALNERTSYTGAQTDANIDLQSAQLNFLTRVAKDPPPTDEEALALYEQYVDSVSEFLDLAEKTRDQQDLNPYPTVEDLTACLKQSNKDTKEPSE